MASKHRQNVSKPQTTTRASNRRRAALAGQADKVRPHRTVERHVIDPNSENEVYGALLSERRRMGESNPRVPEAKTRSTKSIEAKSVPPTGVAKRRKR